MGTPRAIAAVRKTSPSTSRVILPFILALLPGLILVAYYLAVSHREAGLYGFPLDDSWIHAQFARNLATGAGFTYTGGQWVSGSTAPLWTLLFAAGYAVVRNPVGAAFLLGTASQLVAGYYAIRLAELLGARRVLALMAGTIVVVLPVIVWGAVSGMEVPLAAALVLAGLYKHFDAGDSVGPRRYIGAGLLGASALARPESLAIVGVALMSDVVGRGSTVARVRTSVARGLVVAAVVSPMVIFSLATLGRPLPSTFYAKSGSGIVRAIETRDLTMAKRDLLTFGPLAVKNFWLILRDQFCWAAYLVVLGIASSVTARRSRRVALTLVGILIVVPFVMGVTAPQRLKPDNVRYAAQLVVLVPPLLVAGTSHMRRLGPVGLLVVGLTCGLTAWRSTASASGYAHAVKNIQELHVKAGRWIADHLPQDAVVGANDVGAIAYFSGRRILDLEGLVSPEVLRYRHLNNRGSRTAMDLRPDFLVIFPTWYPDIVASGLYQEVHRVSISDNYISAGDTLVVYQPVSEASR